LTVKRPRGCLTVQSDVYDIVERDTSVSCRSRQCAVDQQVRPAGHDTVQVKYTNQKSSPRARAGK
jgi:hypothetical protein